jgi:hypothetical protein
MANNHTKQIKVEPISYINIILQTQTLTDDIKAQLNILRNMSHINILSIIDDDNQNLSASVNPDVNVSKTAVNPDELFHKHNFNLDSVKSNLSDNTLLICEYSKKKELLDKLGNGIGDNLAVITYKDRVDTLSYALQSCFIPRRHSIPEYENNLFKKTNLFTIAMPSNPKDHESILLIENILNNSLKPNNFETVTIGLTEDKTIIFTDKPKNHTGGGIRSRVQRLLGKKGKRTKKLSKPNSKQGKLTTNDIGLPKHVNTDKLIKPPVTKNITKGEGNTRKTYKQLKTEALNGKQGTRMNTAIMFKREFMFKMLLKDIKQKNTNDDKYDFIFEYNNLHGLNVLDFILFNNKVGAPSLSLVNRYTKLESKYKLDGKVGTVGSNTGKTKYRTQKKKRLSSIRRKASEASKKLSKKKTEILKQSKIDVILQSNKTYIEKLEELNKLKGIKNFLARKRKQKELEGIKQNLLAKYTSNLANHINVSTLKQK